jgi:hypothetical protein
MTPMPTIMPSFLHIAFSADTIVVLFIILNWTGLQASRSAGSI